MRHALKNRCTENMHVLLELMFVRYANLLRSKYPDKTIRNADVFRSGVKEFAQTEVTSSWSMPEPKFLTGFRPFSFTP